MTAPKAEAEHRLVITRTFDAPRELVWDTWTQREHLLAWLCPKDFVVLFAQGDVRPGGKWRSGMQAPDGSQYIAGGAYRELKQPHRLVFTHAWEKNQYESGVETLVTVTLRDAGNGKTEMTFEQVGFDTVESRDGHEGGWSEAFDNLGAHLGAADRELVITRTFDAPRELVWQAWTRPEHIAKWLGPGPFTVRVDEYDLRVGGQWRYVMIGPDGTEYPSLGQFREVLPPCRLVTTDEFGEGFDQVMDVDLPTGIVTTVVFEDLGDRTQVTIRMSHPTVEDRIKHENMGVMPGWNATLDKLGELLTTLA